MKTPPSIFFLRKQDGSDIFVLSVRIRFVFFMWEDIREFTLVSKIKNDFLCFCEISYALIDRVWLMYHKTAIH